jgi:hypothetical protein
VRDVLSLFARWSFHLHRCVQLPTGFRMLQLGALGSIGFAAPALAAKRLQLWTAPRRLLSPGCVASHCMATLFLQAWYREGAAHEALQRWEPAAQAYFEAFRLNPDTPDFTQVC